MTHVFIVNDETFKIHLEYMFAGTGCSSEAIFYENNEYENPKKKEKEDALTTASERNVVAMIADVSRIRTGDKIIFYLQAANNKHPGLFFGVFKAKCNSFYSPNTEDYLNSKLGKNLNFRVLIEPDEVYAKGVSEHEVLDNLDGITHPSEMCWSLIYRKLKGNRGCTMITDYEADRLIEKIKANNITLNSDSFSFDESFSEIVESENDYDYPEQQYRLSIKDRMLYKANNGKAFEVHLQAYIMQNFDANQLSRLLTINQDIPLWIGNEVSCGVGMQRIDVMTMQEDDENVYINIVELKYVSPYKEIITEQLPWYINWVEDYIAPLYTNKKVVITPTVIAKKLKAGKILEQFKTICSDYSKKYNDNINKDNINVLPISYITFEISDNISFEKVF